ncbi:GXWXG domain-containing protein [Paenibacillus sp. DMB5]|uniref:GXWXG domain-containing protein n=1 Tax=Paenibacillus sp. DMB5 TaxID=1780103 RepID=UPI000B1621E4|nr:GXWXG domain-containing protein [Paenibacillus sp. DMB5]
MSQFSANDFQELYLQKGQLTQAEAFAWFDLLEIVEMDQMRGRWRGSELPSGHPMDGLLHLTGWYGKEFLDAETVHPLLFEKRNGRLFCVNPGLLPLTLPFQLIPRRIVSPLFRLVSPLIRTGSSKARLRMIGYREKLSASMVYDQKAIIDHF